MTDQTATPPKGLRRRPWTFGRATVERVMEPGDAAAAPDVERTRIGGLIGGPAQRRRAKVGQPTPPRRERPPDLEATAQGVQLYGARRAVPAPYQLAGPASVTPADTTGTKLSYRPLEGRPAKVTGIRVNLPAPSAGLAYAVQLLRGGNVLQLYQATAADLEVATALVLEPGDELRVEVTTAGAAGTTMVSAFAVEAWT